MARSALSRRSGGKSAKGRARPARTSRKAGCASRRNSLRKSPCWSRASSATARSISPARPKEEASSANSRVSSAPSGGSAGSSASHTAASVLRSAGERRSMGGGLPRPRHVEHRRALELAAPQLGQGAVGVAQGEGLDLGFQGDLRRQLEELAAVLAGEVGDRAYGALAPEDLVGEGGDVAHV